MLRSGLLQLIDREETIMSAIARDTASVVFRIATEADLPAIEQLLVSSHLPVDGVRAALSGFLVADAGGHVVGVVGMEACGSYGLLRSTAVAPEWRGRGIARRLVEQPPRPTPRDSQLWILAGLTLVLIALLLKA